VKKEAKANTPTLSKGYANFRWTMDWMAILYTDITHTCSTCVNGTGLLGLLTTQWDNNFPIRNSVLDLKFNFIHVIM